MNRLSSVGEYIRQLNNEHIKHHRKVAFTSLLAFFVVFFVVWNLREKGISLTNEVDCGKEEHVHISTCYASYLVCGYEEGEPEKIDNNESGIIYTESVEDIISDLEESLSGESETDITYHIHTPECYEQEVVCEIEDHVHTVECINLEDTPVETRDEDELVKVEIEKIEDIVNELEEAAEEEIIEKEIISEDRMGAAEDPMLNGPDVAELIERKLADTKRPVKCGEIYVVTATGLRHIDEVHEYLWDANYDIEDRYMNIIEGEIDEEGNKAPDAKYIRNAGIPTSWTVDSSEYRGKTKPNGDPYYVDENDYRTKVNSYKYLLHEGYPLQIVVFRDDAMTNFRPESGDYTGCWFYTDPDGDGGAGTINSQTAYTGNSSDTHYIEAIGNHPTVESVLVADINPGGSGANGIFHFDSLSGTDRYKSFFTYVRTPREDYMHSDIEISDGGFFKVKASKNVAGQDSSSTYDQTITTEYDSFVSKVIQCEIKFTPEYAAQRSAKGYSSVNSLIIDNKHYQPLSNDATQHELTSQYKCAAEIEAGNREYLFDIYGVKEVVFTIELSLAAKKSKIVREYSDGHTETDTKDFTNGDGSFTYEVFPLTVRMGKQSIIDAMNKCPAHTGMDFNLLYSEINLELDEPTVAAFEANKALEGDGLDYSQFAFELLDSKGVRIGDPITPDAQGKVHFPEQDYPIPGVYKYKIREIIPEGAICIEPGVYYKDYIRYDGREIDIEVEVKCVPDYVAIVQNGESSVDTVLEATVKYSIDGNIIDPANPDNLTFTNSRVDYKETNLRVNKVWSGSGAHPDHITFRVKRTKNGKDISYLESEAKTVFELKESNGWQMEFPHLPVIVGTDSYTYEIEETNLQGFSPSYKRTDGEGYTNWTITNVVDEDKELYFKKVWKDEDGNVIAGPKEPIDDPNQEVHIKLHRQYQEKEIPIKIKIQPKNAGDKYSDEFEIYGYKGGTATFVIESPPGHADCPWPFTYTNCKCDINWEKMQYEISKIDNGAEVVITYDNITTDQMLLWHTNGPEFNSGVWSFDGGSGQHCYTTFNSKMASDGAQAWQERARVKPDATAQLALDLSVVRPGQYYSISAYLRYNNRFTWGDGENENCEVPHVPHKLRLQLEVTKTDGTKQIIDIADTGSTAPNSGSWYHVKNKMFQIPSGITGAKLLIGTLEDENTEKRYVDLFYDDVIIAPAGYEANVENNTFEAVRRFDLTDHKRSVPTDVTNNVWKEDTDDNPNGEIKGFALSATGNWSKGFKISNLGGSVAGYPELPNRRYRYYVAEEPVPEKYKVTYLNDYAECNNEDNPIVIENRYCAYTLPNTGGIGVNRIRWLGLLVLLFGIPPVMVNLVRKRGGPV